MSLAEKETAFLNSPIVRFMLVCEDGFTYAQLGQRFSPDEDKTRLADKSIQKARRRGWIEFRREGKLTVWRPTLLGRTLSYDQNAG